MGDFGNKFRKAREAKKLSLEDVSNVTKISARMLRAIEEEHFDQLPGGVFNRGFIRAYSKHLGLNEEDAVNEYLACLRQAQVDAREVIEPGPSARASAANKLRVVEAKKAEPKTSAAKTQGSVEVDELPDLQLPRAEDVRPARKEFSESPGFPWVPTIVVIVILAGILLWTLHSRAKRILVPATSSVPSVAPAPAQVPLTQAPAPVASSAPVAHTAKSSAQSAQVAPRSSAIATPTPAAETSPTSKSVVQTLTASNPAPAAKPLALLIRATETSWISVSADGQSVAQETLIAPAHTTVRANNQITVRVGNAAGVNFVLNGKELPPQGAESEARTFVFDAQGMRAPGSIPPP